MIYLLYPVRPTHALIVYDSCITNKASPAFSSLQRWTLPAWEVLTGPLTNVKPVKSQTWDSVTAQAHPRTIPCHQWVKRGIHHISTFSEQNTFLFEVLDFFFHDVFYFLKIELKTLLFFWSRSYAVYSCPETGEPTGTPFMSVLNWRLSCNLILLLRQKGQYLFSRFSLSLYPLWMKKEMTES